MSNMLTRLLVLGATVGMVTGCGLAAAPSHGKTVPSKGTHNHVKVHKKSVYPITVYALTSFPVLGVGSYHLDLLSGYATSNNPQSPLIDLPQGAVWITPSGFLNRHQQPFHAATIWITPWHPGGGSLWNGARSIKTIKSTRMVFTAIGYTGPWAVFGETLGKVTVPLVVNAKTLHTKTVALPITGFSVVQDGFLAYQSGATVVAVNLSTGQHSQAAIPSSSGPHPDWVVVSHGIQIGASRVSLPEIPRMPSLPPAPPGYRWFNSLLVIPSKWPLVTSPAVGSWSRYVATNPANPKESVTILYNYCNGCASPTPVGGPLSAPDAPVLGSAAGTFSWVTDHFISHQAVTSGWQTTTDTMVWPAGSGNLVVTFTVPIYQKTSFSQSLQVGWRINCNHWGSVS